MAKPTLRRYNIGRRMNGAIIQAIKIIREYVYLRDPDDQEIHPAIITAKRKRMRSVELQLLVERSRAADQP